MDSTSADPDQGGQPTNPVVGSISFANLDATDFEEFCHSLLLEFVVR